ncbi:unnamed protein product [Rhodiola kirilowii]
MIGSLLYLTASIPDIAYAVGVCARYHANPKESHLLQVKRIIKYVCGTVDYGIWYTKNTSSYLAGYCDADWAGNAEDRKGTSGGFFFLGNNLVSYFSMKQNSILKYCYLFKQLFEVVFRRTLNTLTDNNWDNMYRGHTMYFPVRQQPTLGGFPRPKGI